MRLLLPSAWLVIVYLTGAHSIDLTCSIVSYSYGSVSGKKCHATTSNIVEQNVLITSINGQTGDYLKGQSVNILFYNAGTVNYLPKGQGISFSHIESLMIQNTKLKEISKYDLEQFPSLKYFYLYGLDVSYLEADLFEFNPNINRVDLHGSSLRFIEENIFDQLTKLDFITLATCTTFTTSKSFKSEIALFKAAISKCQDQEIKEKLKNRRAIKKLQLEIKTLKSKLKSSNGNFEAALSHFHNCTKSFKSTLNPSNNSQISLICLESSDSCDAFNLQIDSVYSIISYVSDENGTAITTNNIKKLSIVDQQTLYLPKNLDSFFSQLSELSVISSGLFSITSTNFARFKQT